MPDLVGNYLLPQVCYEPHRIAPKIEKLGDDAQNAAMGVGEFPSSLPHILDAIEHGFDMFEDGVVHWGCRQASCPNARRS